jgi:hypothetical protein
MLKLTTYFYFLYVHCRLSWVHVTLNERNVHQTVIAVTYSNIIYIYLLVYVRVYLISFCTACMQHTVKLQFLRNNFVTGHELQVYVEN